MDIPTVRSTTELREALLDNVSNFETALEIVRRDRPNLAGLFEDAIYDVFRRQDESERYFTNEGSFNQQVFNDFFLRFRGSDGTGPPVHVESRPSF